MTPRGRTRQGGGLARGGMAMSESVSSASQEGLGDGMCTAVRMGGAGACGVLGNAAWYEWVGSMGMGAGVDFGARATVTAAHWAETWKLLRL